jgi:arginyl-tRNA--protein-N-Asp/Glu arginylyltransferase
VKKAENLLNEKLKIWRKMHGDLIEKKSDGIKKEAELKKHTKQNELEIPFESTNASKEEILAGSPILVHEKKQRKFWTKITTNKVTPEKNALYMKYSKQIHGKSSSDFPRFICNQSLTRKKKTSPDGEFVQNTDQEKDFEESALHLGSYNIEYFLDDLRIAVSVVDLLTSGLISYYVYYEPVFKFLSIGTLTAFWENEFVKAKRKHYPEFRMLYLCYYVPNSPKMSYKANF